MKQTKNTFNKVKLPYIISYFSSIITLFFGFFPALYTLDRGNRTNISLFRSLVFFKDEAVQDVKYGGVCLLVSMIAICLIILLASIALFVRQQNRTRITVALGISYLVLFIALITGIIFFSKTGSHQLYLAYGIFLFLGMCVIDFAGSLISYLLINKTKSQE